MKYLNERALYYHFLMSGIVDEAAGCWKFVSEFFGVSRKEVKAYESVLANPMLAYLVTPADVNVYKNYLNGFLCGEDEFGKSKSEQDVIEAKALALGKITTLFGEDSVKCGRLRALSHIYEGDHIACVLYALHILYINDGENSRKFAENILLKELAEGNNSDAGLVLLKLGKNTEEVVSRLASTPDMLLRPDVLREIKKHYGGKGGDGAFSTKRIIGF